MEDWLSQWYSKCRNKYIDLIGDFGGTSTNVKIVILFVKLGDGLLIKTKL